MVAAGAGAGALLDAPHSAAAAAPDFGVGQGGAEEGPPLGSGVELRRKCRARAVRNRYVGRDAAAAFVAAAAAACFDPATVDAITPPPPPPPATVRLRRRLPSRPAPALPSFHKRGSCHGPGPPLGRA